jgi:hypothetical protein
MVKHLSQETTISREEGKDGNDRTLVKIYKASLEMTNGYIRTTF